MIVRKHQVRRGGYVLHVERMVLPDRGVVLLKGENGSGKTTWIESILKSDRIEDIPPPEKSRRITYFSQQLHPYESTGNRYLDGCDPALVQKYCAHFAFDLLEKEILHLSGGEFVTLALIRCLAMDAPILILDEPTNNLDDEAVRKLAALLEDLSKEKFILLSTHDERLDMGELPAIQVANGKASYGCPESEPLEKQPPKPGRRPGARLGRTLLFSRFNGMLFAVMLFCGLLTTMLASHFLLNQVPDMDAHPDDDVINLMWIAEEYASYIPAVVSRERVEKEFAGRMDTLDVEELLALSRKDFVEAVYVVDTGYLATLESGPDGAPGLVSIPEIVARHPLHTGAYPGCGKFLLAGRLPRDGMDEAMLSFARMQEHFGYRGDADHMLGQTIKIDGNPHTVVGLTSLPYISISFAPDRKKPYGAILVTGDSEGDLRRMLSRMESLGYGDLVFEDIFVRYDKGRVGELMDYLMKHGPSYQYSSAHVDGIIEKAAFTRVLPEMMALSLVLALLLSAILGLMASRMFLLVGNRIRDMDNRNYAPLRNRLVLTGVFAMDFLFMTAACLLEGAFVLGTLQRLTQLLPFLVVNALAFGLLLVVLWLRSAKHA